MGERMDVRLSACEVWVPDQGGQQEQRAGGHDGGATRPDGLGGHEWYLLDGGTTNLRAMGRWSYREFS